MSNARKSVDDASISLVSANTHVHADQIVKPDPDSENSSTTSETYGSGEDSFNIVNFKKLQSSSDSESEDEILKRKSFQRTPIPSIVVNDPDTPKQVHSPTRHNISPTRILQSPPKDSHTPQRHSDSPLSDSNSSPRDTQSPSSGTESPLRNIVTPPRQLPIPLKMAMVQAISPSLYYGKEGEDATAHYYSYLDWLAEVARTAQDAAAQTEAIKIAMFKLTLRGEARKWIEHLNFTTTANLKIAFKDRFSKEPTREQDIESIAKNKLQPNETVGKYAERITQTSARLQFTEEFTRDWFQSGLPIQMQLYVKGSAPETLKDAVKRAKEYERLCKTKTESVTSNVQFSLQDDESVTVLDQLRLLVLQGKEKARSDSPHPNRVNSFTNNNNSDKQQYQRYDNNRQTDRYDSRNGSRDRNYPRQQRNFSYDRNRSQRSYSSDRQSNYNGQRQGQNSNFRGRSRERTPDRGRNVGFDNSQYNRGNSLPRREYDRNRSPSRERGRQQEKSYKKPDRFQSQSPKREATKSTGEKTILTCWICGKTGHFYKKCQQERALPFQCKMQMEGMKKFLTNVEHFTQNNE